MELPGGTNAEGLNRGSSALYVSTEASLPEGPGDLEDPDPLLPCLDPYAVDQEPQPALVAAAAVTPGECVKRSTRRNRKRAARRRELKREHRLKQVQLNLLRKIKVFAGNFDSTDLPKSKSGYLGTASSEGNPSPEPPSSHSIEEIPPTAHPYLHELSRKGYRVVKADHKYVPRLVTCDRRADCGLICTF